MKNIFFYMFLFGLIMGSCRFYGQQLDLKSIQKLEDFGIKFPTTGNTLEFDKDMFHILKKDRKSRKNKVVGSVVGGLGLTTTALGIVGLTRNRKNPYGQVASGMITTLGAINIGISFALFRTSKKRQKERDQIIRKYNSHWETQN